MVNIKKIFSLEKESYIVRNVDHIDMVISPTNIIEETETHTKVFLQGAMIMVSMTEKSTDDTFVMKLGTIVDVVPSEILSDSIYGGNGEHKVMRFYEGDKFIKNKRVVADVTNIDFLFNDVLLAGKISGVPYKDVIDIFNNNIKLNTPLNLTSLLKESIVAIIMRDKDKPEQPVRLRKDGDYNKYISANARTITQLSSTHGAMTFEDSGTSTILSSVRGKDTDNAPNLAKYFML